jgi:hypothetical protein
VRAVSASFIRRKAIMTTAANMIALPVAESQPNAYTAS